MVESFNGENNVYSTDSQKNLLSKTFFWMFLGLIATAIVSAYTYYSGFFAHILTEGYFEFLLILELVVVLLFSFLFRKLSPTIVGILYFIYARNKWCYNVCYICSF